jgi:hypothetical protein
MARRLLARLTAGPLLAALLAALAAGCGSASTTRSTSRSTSPPASGSPAATATSQTSTSAGASQASTPDPTASALPAGFSRYQADGFSFVAPSGMKAAPGGGISGLPKGASAATLTPGGKSLESTNTQIMEAYNPRLRSDVSLGEVATSLQAADLNDPSVMDLHTSLSTMTVAGAQDVRTVTESYIARDGAHAKTVFHRIWLMVMPRPGVLMDLVVIVEPQRGGTLDPTTVLDSFRLNG